MLNIVRFEKNGSPVWGVYHSSQTYQLDVPCTSTKALLELGRKEIKQLAQTAVLGSEITDVQLLSPITQDAKVLCQGANYRQHMIAQWRHH